GTTTYTEAKTVTVSVSAPGDTAIAGTDYAAVADFEIAVPAGTASATGSFSLNPVDDAIDEADETLSVTGAAPGVASIGAAAVTITDNDAAPVISINSPSVDEGNSGSASLIFTVSLDNPSGRTVSVSYADTGGGTATSGTDYAAVTAGTLSFEPGVTGQSIAVSVRGDTEEEDDETVQLRLSSAAGATLSGGGATLDASGTITDDDDRSRFARCSRSDIEMYIDDTEGLEGETFEFRVHLSHPSPGDIAVQWGTFPETAKTSEFHLTTGSLSFAEGEQEKLIYVRTYEDDKFDPYETFSVDLSEPSCVTLVDMDRITPRQIRPSRLSTSAVMQIKAIGTLLEAEEGPPPLDVSLAPHTLSAREGEELRLRVKAATNNQLPRAVWIPLIFTNGTAEAGDYNALDAGVFIPPGRNDGTAYITLFHDIDTDDETFTVSIGQPHHREARVVEPSSVELTIRDDGGAGIYPDLDFEIDVDTEPPVVTEPQPPRQDCYGGWFDCMGEPRRGDSDNQNRVAESSGATKVLVTAWLEGQTRFAEDRTVSVSIGDASDSATEDVDYRAADFTLVIPGGRGSGGGTFTLTPIDDTLVEANEKISVEGRLGTLASAGSRIFLIDDEQPTLSIDDAEADEGDAATFTVRLSRAAPADVTVTATTSDGSAQSPGDYTHTSQVLTIKAGQTSAAFSVPTLADGEVELHETFTVTLSEASNAGIADATATGTITGADSLIAIGDASAVEGADLTFTLTRSGDASASASVQWTTGTDPTDDASRATPGTDYTAAATAQTVSFAAGETSQTVNVTSLSDALIEDNETFAVRLAGASAGAAIADATGIGTIIEGTAGFSVADASAAEGEAVTLTVTRQGVTTGASTVKWRTAEDTSGDHPAGSADYTASASAQTLSFAAGETAKTVTVQTTEDAEAEADETFLVVLSEPGGGSVLIDASALVTITDDDAPRPALVIAPTTLAVDEGGSADYTVALATEPSGAVTVTLSGHDGTDL
ncbi:MAG: hypothetical protein OXC61_03445, partial [Flavobacteriaceae bacterium]|nr:hypothetical protein [Flavobacteriaceae bacterium]